MRSQFLIPNFMKHHAISLRFHEDFSFLLQYNLPSLVKNRANLLGKEKYIFTPVTEIVFFLKVRFYLFFIFSAGHDVDWDFCLFAQLAQVGESFYQYLKNRGCRVKSNVICSNMLYIREMRTLPAAHYENSNFVNQKVPSFLAIA